MTDAPPPPPRHRPGRLLACVIVSLVACVLLSFNSSLPREGVYMVGIFLLAALLWITESLPLFATSLLVVGLEILFLANPGGWSGLGFEQGKSPSYRAIVASAADPVLMLFFGGFLLARAAVKESVDRSMSALLLRGFGNRPRWVLLGVLLITALFSMWMSNTATTAMMITLVGPMLATLKPGDAFRKGLVLAVPVAANIGGMGTPIGSPPNAVAIGFLQQSGHPVTFLQWIAVALPLLLGLLSVSWLLLWRFFPPGDPTFAVRSEQPPMTRRAWFVVGTFVTTVLLWLTDRWHGLPASVVGLLPAIVFTASGVLNREDLNRIEWNILILIGGGIALGSGMQLTGLDQWVVGLLPLEDGGGLLILSLLVVATILLSTFMSNTAAANLILPVGISTALALDAGPGVQQMALSIALAASASMSLPISTPPNAIAYATGEFSTKDLARMGVILGALTAAAILLGGKVIFGLWGLK